MALKRTTVYVDSDDLEAIKEAASRKGVPAAEIIREAVHRAARENRVWDEPFVTETFDLGRSLSKDEIKAITAEAILQKYERRMSDRSHE